ncbi:MAG: tyrosine-type recombinase/integrase [Limisphaerales bacterium]
MKASETEANPASERGKQTTQRRARYQKVLDGRKQPIRGLWKRGGRFYAQLKVTDPQTGDAKVRRIPLELNGTPVDTTSKAVKALNRLRQQREDDALPVLRQPPYFSDYVEEYFAYYDAAKDTKRKSTLDKERSKLELWKTHFGKIRLNAVHLSMIRKFMAKRQADGMSARTVNLDVIALRNVLKMALEDGWLTTLPTKGLRPLKHQTKKKSFFSASEITALCGAALSKKDDGSPITKNGRQFVDYVRLMSLCGTRRDETLALKWADVDFARRQLIIGRNELTKNGEIREVDFSPDLESHLEQMQSRKAPDSDWLFPSPQRGDKDRRVKTFRESLTLAKTAAVQDHPTLADFTFHDCRHHFISMAVMSGIDFMTVAKWVGHKDGGILIGKVYGHLADEHRRRMAQKLNFGPVALAEVAGA